MINRVTLVGHLGRDPDLRRLESGVAVARLRVATAERYRDGSGQWREQTEWHDVTLWRSLAERAETQLRKGMLVYVEGKLSTREFTDRTGAAKRTTEVVASTLRILDRRADVEEVATQQPDAGRQPGITLTPTPPQALTAAAAPRGANAEDSSGLPF